MLKFFHYRGLPPYSLFEEPQVKGGVTFIYDYNKETGTLSFAYAKCHPKENYNKAIGRAVARQRYETDDQWSLLCELPPSFNVHEFFSLFAKGL